jgi:hypothetical protein
MHPRLKEYYKLTLFAEKFLLNKFDLDKCSEEWIDEMVQVHLAIEKYKLDGLKNASVAKSNPTSGLKGSSIKTEKLI